MPGLYGSIAFDNQKARVDGYKMLHNESWLIKEIEIEKGFIGSVSMNHDLNGVFENADYVIGFYGEIFEILGEKETRYQFPITNPESILSIIDDKGDSVIEKFNGTFLIVLYDKKSHRFMFMNDRFGIYPLYYCIKDECFLFASEAKALFADNAVYPDYVGLAEYLSFDYCIGERTIFKDVKYIQPAQRIIIENNQMNITSYWKVPNMVQAKKKSYKSYEDELYRLLTKSVHVRECEKNIIGLTGGFDSRLILAVAGEESDIYSFTFGSTEGGDVKGAEYLAREYKTHHRHVEFDSTSFPEIAREIIYRTDGKCSCDRFYIYATAQEKAKYADVELSGTGGDAISGQKSNFTGLLPIMNRRISEQGKKRYCKKLLSNVMRGRLSILRSPSIYGQQFSQNVWPLVEREFANEFKNTEGNVFGNLILQFKCRTLERNCTIPHIGLCNNFIKIRYPIYDYNVFDFFATCPQTLRYGQRLYIKMIHDYFPKAARAPHSETGRPISGHDVWKIDLITVTDFARRVFKIKPRKLSSTFEFVKQTILAQPNEYYHSIISEEHSGVNGIFDIHKYGNLDGLLMSMRQGNSEAYILVKNILNIELMNQYLFDGKIETFLEE